VGVAKYMMKNVSFELFPQALFIVAIARNVLGGILFSAFIGHWSHDLVLDYISKSASKMDAVSTGAAVNQIQSVAIKAGASTIEAAQAASGMLYGKVYLQSLLLAGKEIFGMVTLFGILLTFGILLYHFSKPFELKIPRWNSIIAKMKNKGMIVVEKVE
jgi:DHA2 family multidrug resistance protein